jgi:glutamate carboxypeptidase
MATRKKQAIYAENSVQKAVVANERALLDRIRQLVAIESPSDDKKAVDRCVDAVVEMAAAVGGRVRRHRQRAFGDVLELRFGGGGKAERKLAPVLLLGHLDTVWPLGTLSSMPFQVAKGRA